MQQEKTIQNDTNWDAVIASYRAASDAVKKRMDQLRHPTQPIPSEEFVLYQSRIDCLQQEYQHLQQVIFHLQRHYGGRG